MTRRRALRWMIAAVAPLLVAATLPAQDTSALRSTRTAALSVPDTVSLRALHEAAMARDARAGARDLLHTAGRLRDEVIAGDRYARPLLAGQLTHQSDVTSLPVRLPGNDIPTPPFTRYQAVLELDQPLYDAGAVRARRGVERARTTEADADVQARLYGVTAEVNAALFTLLLQQAQEDALTETLAVFDARLAEARVRVAEGAALARDTSLLVAERLRLEEQRDLLRTRRNVARAQLRSLTGRDVGERPTLPALDAFAAARPATLGDHTPRTRPEFGRFDATRARLAEEVRAAAVESRPRVSAFVQGGFGRPGLNQLRPDTDAFYLAGVRVAWRPLAHRDAERNAEALRVQQRLLDLEAQAFADQLSRVVLADLADIERLDALVASDRAQVAARADVARVAQLELDEGIITTAQWITPQADLADARLAAARHDVERVYAWARLYTTLALPLP